MKMKSKAQNPFLEKNLIIFPDHQNPNVKCASVLLPETLSKTQLILPPKSFLELHCTTGQARVMQ